MDYISEMISFVEKHDVPLNFPLRMAIVETGNEDGACTYETRIPGKGRFIKTFHEGKTNA